MTVTALTEAVHPFAYLVSEEGHGMLSRDAITIGASQTITVGMVLGRTAVIASTTSSVAADSGNTGGGSVTLDGTTPVLAAAIDGNYRLVCVVAGASAVFEVFDPKAVYIGRYTVGGSAFATQIKFTAANSGSNFAIGDAFTVTVGIEYQGDVTYGALDLSATTGLQNAFAIAGYPATTGAGATAQIAATVRNSEVRLSDLTWPAGITAAQKAEAIEQLRARGIIGR